MYIYIYIYILFQADVTSPTGIPIIAVICHTVDGQGKHAAPGKGAARRAAYKAQCATNVIAQVVQHRAQGRASSSSQGQPSALASSQGQPSIIIAGDLNVTAAAFKEQLGFMCIAEDVDLTASHWGNMFVISDCTAQTCDGLPRIRGPDNQHEVGFFDVTADKPCAWSSTNLPDDCTFVRNDVYEQEVSEQAVKAQQSSSRGSGSDDGDPGRPGSTLVSQGRPCSTMVDRRPEKLFTMMFSC